MVKKEYIAPTQRAHSIVPHSMIAVSLHGSTEKLVANPYLETLEEDNGGADLEW